MNESTSQILVVDDNASCLRILAAQLRHDHHEVITAQSGEQALEILALNAVDCILIDMLMSGIDGVETARRIKAMPQRREIPIIMLTGTDTREARATAGGLEIDDFVVKSSRLDIIRVRVRMALRRSRARRGPTADSARTGAAYTPHGMSFFERVIAVSGLPSELARSMIETACGCSGDEAVSPAEFLHALASVREALSAYWSSDETTVRIAAMAAIARLSEARHCNQGQTLDTSA
jgi:CheY-like chemotaxis protein